MKDRITMRDIAREAKVSHVAVSLALRNHHSIPETTRTRIRKIAERLGYRPDPMLSALNAYRTTQFPVQYQATLGWIDASPFGRSLRSKSRHEHHYWFKGAERRARELGYHLEVFSLVEEAISSTRLVQILRGRQIQGLLLPPLVPHHTQLDLPWERFTTVAFGFSHRPDFDIVINAQYRSAQLAVRNLHRLGYRRIGFVTLSEMAERTNYNFNSGIWSESSQLGIKPLILQLPSEKFDLPQVKAKIVSWIKKVRPDVLLTTHGMDGLAMINQAGLRTPEEVAWATLSRLDSRSDVAGIHQKPEQIGTVAVNHLVGLLQRGEVGFPANPLRILVEGEWIDALSAPAKQGKLR